MASEVPPQPGKQLPGKTPPCHPPNLGWLHRHPLVTPQTREASLSPHEATAGRLCVPPWWPPGPAGDTTEVPRAHPERPWDPHWDVTAKQGQSTPWEDRGPIWKVGDPSGRSGTLRKLRDPLGRSGTPWEGRGPLGRWRGGCPSHSQPPLAPHGAFPPVVADVGQRLRFGLLIFFLISSSQLMSFLPLR